VPFNAAGYLAIAAALLIMLLWLILPAYAALSIRRRRRNRPNSSCWLGYTVIAGWTLTLLAYVVWLLHGNWYGENTPPEVALIQAALGLGVIIAVYAALTASGKPRE
jgi:TRAP-type C4-dicarboxylate transport system permease large subunit